MKKSRRDQVWSTFRHSNESSSSGGGVESSVRSFRSFIKTMPPNSHRLSDDKASQQVLPIEPELHDLPPFMPPRSSSYDRTARENSWTAPEEWSNAASFDMESHQQSAQREYSPLLPEPSPDPVEKNMEPRFSIFGSLDPRRACLIPIFEGEHPESELSNSPQRESPPLVTLSEPGGQSEQSKLLPSPRREASPLQNEKSADSPRETCNDQKRSSTSSRSASAVSTRSHHVQNTQHTHSQPYVPTQEKAYVALGIESYGSTIGSQGISSQSSEQSPIERKKHHRNKMLQVVNTGSVFRDDQDDEDDAEMDQKTRQLSFSQDYHEMLTDQEEDMEVSPEDILREGPPTTSNLLNTHNAAPAPKVPSSDHDLVPQPLAWRAEPKNPSPAGASSQGVDNIAFAAAKPLPTPLQEHRRLSRTSWVPRRLSVGHRRVRSDSQIDPLSPDRPYEPTHSISESPDGVSERDYTEASDDRDDFGFSAFQARTKSKKTNRQHPTKSTPGVDSGLPAQIGRNNPADTNEIVRLGSFALVRTRQGSVDVNATDSRLGHHRSDSDPAHALPVTIERPIESPEQHNPNNPITPPSSAGSTAAGALEAIMKKVSTPRSTTHSQQSSSSSHPRVHDIAQPGRTSTSPAAGLEAEAPHKLNVFEKARDMRRRHEKEKRQEKLKKQIRVLGPTDPQVMAEYVKDDSGKKPRWML